ncbi:MAG: nucleoside hydrolase, partial [Chloroflexi bacterium]|nr:nucleoside hydrolase [Chloroflexota bacterium]
MSPRPMIIDTDAGVDDALAILMALAHPDFDVVGITTLNGNVSLPNV